MNFGYMQIADELDSENELEVELDTEPAWLSLGELKELRDHIDQILKKQEAGE